MVKFNFLNLSKKEFISDLISLGKDFHEPSKNIEMVVHDAFLVYMLEFIFAINGAQWD